MRLITDVVDFGDATEIQIDTCGIDKLSTTPSVWSYTPTRSSTGKSSASSSCGAGGIAPRGWPTRRYWES
jgi:hypothetical protein